MPTTDAAAPLVANLGFLLRRDLPTDRQDALLVIAMREIPTLRHYDPELIAFWRAGDDGRGHRAELTLASSVPVAGRFSWGPIEIVDRLGVTNTFVAFGGSVAADRTEPGTIVATFRSRGPILRRGGHSQRYDQLAASMTAFYGRLFPPIDFQPGVEARIAATPSGVLYAAFLRHEVARIAESELVRDMFGPDARLVRVEAERARRRSPDDWEAGGELLRAIGLLRPAA
jgi:hypothetical protein